MLQIPCGRQNICHLSYLTWGIKGREMDPAKADRGAAPYLCWYSRPQGQVGHIGHIAHLIHKGLAILNGYT